MSTNSKELGKRTVLILACFVALSSLCVPILWWIGISGHFFLLAGWSFLFLLAVSALFASTFWMIRTKLLISKEDKVAFDGVRQRLKALEALEKDLADFLSDFDNRSRKYFHATSQKSVHTYFKLRNIHAGLLTFFEAARPVRQGQARPGSARFDEIDNALSGTFEYSNSVLGGPATREQLPFVTLEQKVHELKVMLDESVRDIERELRAVPKAAS